MLKSKRGQISNLYNVLKFVKMHITVSDEKAVCRVFIKLAENDSSLKVGDKVKVTFNPIIAHETLDMKMWKHGKIIKIDQQGAVEPETAKVWVRDVYMKKYEIVFVKMFVFTIELPDSEFTADMDLYID